MYVCGCVNDFFYFLFFLCVGLNTTSTNNNKYVGMSEEEIYDLQQQEKENTEKKQQEVHTHRNIYTHIYTSEWCYYMLYVLTCTRHTWNETKLKHIVWH